MAERRMFTKKITNSDEFISMPHSSQNLYFHLNMEADDEGFVNGVKRIMRTINANEDDLRILITKRFLIVFESGVIVIKHWKLHNSIRNDRFKPTDYITEKSQIIEKDNGIYTDLQPNDNQETTTWVHRLGKDSIGKDSIGKKKRTSHFVPPSLEELQSFILEHGYNVNAETFINHYEAVGWRVGKNKMKDWKAAVRSWNSRNKEVKKQTTQRTDELPDWWNNESESKELIVDREKIINQIKKGETSE